MCGIVGFITKKDSKSLSRDRSDFFRQALVIDTLRGDDSTGVVAVGHDPLYKDRQDLRAWYLKELGNGANFVESKEYHDEFGTVGDYRCLVGHNRAATRGAVDQANAHPFQHGPITLVHNGTLTSTWTLPEPMNNLKNVDVDSEAICYNLANYDAEEVIENLDGAFTLVWHDARDDSINMIRNDERPMHLAAGQNNDTVFFMSEAEMLALLNKRIGLGVNHIYRPKPGLMMRWMPDTAPTAPLTKKLDLYEYSYRGGNNTNYYNGNYNYNNYKNANTDLKPNVHRANNSYQNFNAAFEENRVMVGGSLRRIPSPLQEQLLSKNYLVEDRLVFTPESSVPSTNEAVRSEVVMGTVEDGTPTIIYNALQNSSNAMNKKWIVRPIGIKKLPGDMGHLLVAKHVTSHPEYYEPYKKLLNGVAAPNNDTSRFPLALVKEGTTYEGPDGNKITAQDLQLMLIDGCTQCAMGLSIADAQDIVWTSQKEPLCWDCQEEWKNLFGTNGGIE